MDWINFSQAPNLAWIQNHIFGTIYYNKVNFHYEGEPVLALTNIKEEISIMVEANYVCM